MCVSTPLGRYRRASAPVGRGWNPLRGIKLNISLTSPYAEYKGVRMVKVCPVCGTENQDDAEVCQGCNIRLSSVTTSAPGAKTDTEIDELVKSILVKKETPKPTAETKKTPPKEESRKTPYEIPIPEKPEVKTEVVEERTFRCPTCNAKVPASATKCPKCGTLFKYEENAFNCPVCNTLLPYSAKTCPKCHAEFEEEPAPEQPTKVEVSTEAEQKPVVTGKAPHPSQVLVEPQPGPQAPAPPAEEHKTPPPPQQVKSEVRPTPQPAKIYEEEVHVSFISRFLVDILIIVSLGILAGIFLGFRMWELTDIFWYGFIILLISGVLLSALIFVLFNKTSADITQGDRLMQQRRYVEAIRYYDRAIKLGMSLGVAWTNKGVAYKKLGRYTEALSCFNRAIQIEQKNEVAWTNKGDIYFKMGRFGDAIQCYQEAININPRYEVAWNNMGVANERIGAFKEAERCYDTAIKLKPRYRTAWLNKGDLLARTGRQSEAQQCYRSAGVM